MPGFDVKGVKVIIVFSIKCWANYLNQEFRSVTFNWRFHTFLIQTKSKFNDMQNILAGSLLSTLLIMIFRN